MSFSSRGELQESVETRQLAKNAVLSSYLIVSTSDFITEKQKLY